MPSDTSTQLGDLAAEIAGCLLRDRHRLRQRLQALARARRGEVVAEIEALAGDIARSRGERERRRENAPRPTYPPELPITQRRDEIAAAIRKNQVVIVCGETGSGKTTQLPKICLEVGRGVDGVIGHTQPRRLAARTLSARIASELGVEMGRAVGHKIRFTDRTSDATYIKLMTDGILLAETQADRFLERYDTIIVDEAHERSLNIDFLLGYLKRLLPKRPDLKVIVTSATIDPQRFSEHFGGAPVLEVSGRTYPVEVRYRPLVDAETEDGDAEESDPHRAILDALRELQSLPKGDVLVFLPGERAIRETADAVRKSSLANIEVLPLYARLSAGEQERIFRSHAGRRVVLSTNVAETSLTVPGIRYVVDTGLARVSRYDPRRKVQRLPIERVSQASANQRAGRCGRTSAGVCIRLYAESDFASRPPFTKPEVQRTNLAGVILQMEALGLGSVEQFPFVEAPDARAVRDGYATLFELGAIDEEHRLTRVGRELARFPVDPRVGRMLLAARDHRCVNEILVIASALSVQDPRTRPHGEEDKADQAHARFRDDTSDFTTFLNLWRAFEEESLRLSSRKLRNWCEASFVSFLRMREWQDVHDQLHRLMRDTGVRVNEKPASDSDVHKALLTGLLGGVARKADDRTYLGARNVKLNVFPGSGLAKKRPEWIMAAELVETDRLYARTLAKIDPAWIEPLAPHLVTQAYFEPHWEKNRGQVIGYERVALHGLTIIERRKIDFARIDAEAAREIFLQSALVCGELRTPASFLRHNRALVEKVQSMQERSRRRDLLVDEQAVYAFYDRVVPGDVHSAAAFERWRKQVEATHPMALCLKLEDVVHVDPSSVTDGQFPDTLDLAGWRAPISYRFEPGHPEDGLTVTVPLALLPEIAPERLEWLVPGLLLEKVTGLLESLPKALRRNFVPIPEMAERCAKVLAPGDLSLVQALADELERATGTRVPPESFRIDTLAPHLSMNVRVVDDSGSIAGVSRDCAALIERLALRADESFARMAKPGLERDRVMAWDFGDLPSVVQVPYGAFTLPGYPALASGAQGIAVRVFRSEALAAVAHRAGLRSLYALRLADVVKSIRRNLPDMAAMTLAFALLGSADDLRDDLVGAALDRICIGDGPLTREAAEFETVARRARGELAKAVCELCERVGPILSTYNDILRSLPRGSTAEPYREIKEHLATLVHRGFVTATPRAKLAHLPRYLKAIKLRLARLGQYPQKDRERAAALAPLVNQLRERLARRMQDAVRDPELDRYRWLLEEWRVSLFAQELKTAEPVSEKRLSDQWARVAP